MKQKIVRSKGERFVFIGLLALIFVTLLATTVFAVSVGGDVFFAQKPKPAPAAVGAQAGAATGEGETSRYFSWSIGTGVTGADTGFKPKTTLTGKFGSSTASTQDVTSTASYIENLSYESAGDEIVTVTVGGDNSGQSAVYNTNLVYTLIDPSTSSVYARFRIFRDTLIPIETDQAALDSYVTDYSFIDVADTYGTCETITFKLNVPANGMNVIFTPMYTYMPVEIRQQIVTEDGTYVRDAGSDLSAKIERYPTSPSYYDTDYIKTMCFDIESSPGDYYANLTGDRSYVTQCDFSGASGTMWMARGFQYDGMFVVPDTVKGYDLRNVNFKVESRSGETVTKDTYISGLASSIYDYKNRLEYGNQGGWDSAYIAAAKKITVYVNYTVNYDCVPDVTPGSTYTVTVSSTYESAVDNENCRQTIEIYNDTTQPPAATALSGATATLPAENMTPAINVKSSNKVSVKSVVVKDAGGSDITQIAFGSAQCYNDFIESCQNSLFGYFELQNITGDITVDVVYDAPVEDRTMGGSGSGAYYSVTVVTKGEVGPYTPAYKYDYRYQDVYSNNGYATYVPRSTPTNYPGYLYYHQDGHYHMRDGGQITRYDYGNHKTCFDLSVYSYIADIKMYYNDTGEETGVDLSAMTGPSFYAGNGDHGHTYTGRSLSDDKYARSITYVVTYKKYAAATVYARLHPVQSKSSRQIIAVADEGGRFAENYYNYTADKTYAEGIDENEVPLDRINQSGGNYGKVTVVNSDSVEFHLKNESANSLDFSNVKVYALDVIGNRAGEQIAGEGCTDPKVTVTVTPAERTGWSQDGVLRISGLNSYGGDIYVTCDDYRYNSYAKVRTSGEHTDDLIITASDPVRGAISTGTNPADENMVSSVTIPASSGAVNRYFYTGTSYTFRSSGSQKIDRVKIDYYSISSGWVYPEPIPADENGVVNVEVPADIMYADVNIGLNFTVYYAADSVTAYEAQVYMTASGAPVTYEYYVNNSDPDSKNMVELSGYDSSTGAEKAAIFHTYSDSTTLYQTQRFKTITSNSNERVYKILPGTKVKVSNIFRVDRRAASGSVPQTILDQVNRGMEFTGVRVYNASGFNHYNGTATVGTEIAVTQEGDGYTFIMPENGVRIVPSYVNHLRYVNVVASDRDAYGRNYRANNKSTRGTVTLTGDDDNWFMGYGFYDFDNNHDTIYHASHTWSQHSTDTIDGSTYTLSATPKTEDGVQLYNVSAVKAYKYSNSNFSAAFRNGVYTDEAPDVCDWLTYDAEGNILSEEIPGVVGTLSEPAEDGTRTCSVTIPNDPGAGNIILFVDFEPNVSIYAPVTYITDVENGTSFKPETVFTGDIQDTANGKVTATNGSSSFSTAFYKEDVPEESRKKLTMTIGGNSSNPDSIFYNTYLTYDVTSSDGSKIYGKFRYFQDQLTILTDDREDSLNNVGDIFEINDAEIGSYDSSYKACGYVKINIKVPEDGLKITMTSSYTYIPLTVEQYVIGDDGTVTAAPDAFTATVDAAGSGDDFQRNKYFYKSFVNDYYSLLSMDQSEFTSSFTVTGASEKRNAAYGGLSSSYYYYGYNITPVPAEGYMLAGFDPTATNRDSDPIRSITEYDAYFNRESRNPDRYGDAFRFKYAYFGYGRSSAQTVRIYYQKQTSLVVKQTYSGTLGNTLPSINVTNADTAAPAAPYKPFIYNTGNSTTDFKDSVNITNNSYQITERDPENPNERYRTVTMGLNKGARPSVKVTLAGSRNIASLRLLKKDGDDYAEVPATAYTVEGSGDVNTYIRLTFNSGVDIGENYLIDIVYGNQMTFTVKGAMMSDNNQILTDDDYDYSRTMASIRVDGHMTGPDGSVLEEKPFKPTGEGSAVSTFFVNQNPVTYNAFTNTKVTVTTTLNENSQYVIANVVAYNDSGSNQNLVTPNKVKDPETGKELGSTYGTCTLSSLTSTDNVTLIVYFAKVADVKVSVYTIGDDPDTIMDGVPHGYGENGVKITNSTVNVSVIDGNALNKNAIITAQDEGGYYTGDIEVTYEPNVRNVKVLQGSYLKLFAQVPNDARGRYVVRKVVTNGTGYQNPLVNNITTFTDSDESNNLRIHINTGSERISANETYDLKIYIEKAKTIYTRTTTVGGSSVTSARGTVTMKGVTPEGEAGVLPFTVVKPSNSFAYTSYNAVDTSSYDDYTSEARCVRDTALSFTVDPEDNYEIQSVTVKRGVTKASAQDIAFEQTSSDSGTGAVTYTITDPMSYNYNLYVDVVFTVTQWGRVTIDYQYSEDLVNYKYYLSPENGLADLGISTYWGPSVTKVRDGDEYFDNKSGVRFEGTHTYEVIAGTEFRTLTTLRDPENYDWYMAAECWVYDNNKHTIRNNYTTGLSDRFGLDATVNANDDLTFHLRLIPCSTIGAVSCCNNCYDDTPENVYKEDNGSVGISAHFVNDNYPVVPPAAMYVYPSCCWTNSFSFGYNGDIAYHSQIDKITVDYKSTIKPGKIRSVKLYKFSKVPGEGLESQSHVNTSYTNLDPSKALETWDVTDRGVLDDKGEYYNYDLTDLHIITEKDYAYRAAVIFDMIEVTGNHGDYFDTYLVYANSPDSVNVGTGVTSTNQNYVKRLTTRLDENYAKRTQKAYFVAVSKLPADEFELTYASVKDYELQEGQTRPETVDITQEMKASYTTRTTAAGITKYYYIYELNPGDPCPTDNSMDLYVSFSLKKENPSVPVEENLDCDVTVEQWNRDTYDGQYVVADNQSVEFSAEEGSVLMFRETGVSANPLTVTAAKDYLFTQRRTKLIIKPLPAEGYNVEKIYIRDLNSGYYYTLSDSGYIEHTTQTDSVEIKIYYSRPILRISATNEGKASKAQVDVYNQTEQTTATVLDANTFTSGVFVTKNDDAQVIIHPIRYQSGSVMKYYTVASIRVGDIYDDTTTVYTEDHGAYSETAYSVEKNDDGSEFILTINDIQKDKYIFIQLRGDEQVLSSNLRIRQQIKLPGTDEYVDCTDGNYGTVITSASNEKSELPLNFDGVDTAGYTLSEAASAEGTVLYNSYLTMNVTPPGEYAVKAIEAKMNGASVNVQETSDGYMMDVQTPNSGSTVITVKYALPTVDYTLNYIYQGIKGANNGSNYGDDDLESDEKTYTVTAELYPADLTAEGLPTAKALIDHAPAVTDLYKDCTWTIDDQHVTYVNTDEEHSATVRADQDVRTYTVEFRYNDMTRIVERCKLNQYATVNDEFIEAEEYDGENRFACWIVTDKDQPLPPGEGDEPFDGPIATDDPDEEVPTRYKEIARCYDRQFNLRVTGNYIVTAYYEEAANAVYINDPEFSRQQYTDDNGKQVDRLYADFILAFMEKNGLLLNPAYGRNIDKDGNNISDTCKSGLILEYDPDIKLVKPDAAGETLSDAEKEAAYALYTEDDVLTEEDAIDLVTDSAPSLSDGHRYVNYTIRNSSYNNKNRLDKSISFGNSSAIRHLVMRAYYYVYDPTSETIEMTAPVYFYLYDIGNSVPQTDDAAPQP